MLMFNQYNAIDSDIEVNILSSLGQIEKDHHVKILHAVESGSRAWGFHSEDSDYDVRFFYIHKQYWYLTIYPGRDVIEIPIDTIYDISGWDIKKTLHLALKSNAVVMEWLQSPIIYKTNHTFTDALNDFCTQAYDQKALMHHYINLGARQLDQAWRTSDIIPIKKYFYMLRPAMALQWLEQNKTSVKNIPMNIQELMQQSDTPADICNLINELIEQKKNCIEKKKIERIDALDHFMNDIYDRAKIKVLSLPDKTNSPIDKANLFFREWIK